MESTGSTIIPKPTFDCRQLAPTLRRLYISLPTLFSHPSIRPPVLEEMQEDLERTIASLATRYTDQTCPQLHFDELVAEGRYKLAQLIHRGELERQPTRVNFFKFFKASVNNQFRSLVQKHRFTHKRTGVKPPRRHRPKDVPMTDHELELEAGVDHRKHVEISLDDPDSTLQVAEEAHGSEFPAAERELLEDYEQVLTPIEVLVLRELVSPGPGARCYAELDAHVGRKPGSVHVKFRYEHHAKGLGMDPDLFREAVLSIQAKISAYNAMSQDEQEARVRRSAAIAQLSEAFGVQVPASIDETVVARLFTLAARDQYTKVRDQPQLAELLDEVGAKVARVHGSLLGCYGVLYQRLDKRCMVCGLRQSCAVEAANVGLGKIALSPQLLGAKATRVPAILPTLTSDNEPKPEVSTSVEMDVLAYLNETFTRLKRQGVLFYIHQPNQDASTRRRRLLFALESVNPMRLRFCNPSERLRGKLVGKQKSWYAPDLSANEIVELIEQHAEEMFELPDTDEVEVDHGE